MLQARTITHSEAANTAGVNTGVTTCQSAQAQRRQTPVAALTPELLGRGLLSAAATGDAYFEAAALASALTGIEHIQCRGVWRRCQQRCPMQRCHCIERKWTLLFAGNPNGSIFSMYSYWYSIGEMRSSSI
jgi:hypothetical protein